jgi:hypothetical protein
MFVAELRGKLPGDVQRMEDILTSYFFGTAKYLPMRLLLFPWLKSIGLDSITTDSDGQFSFSFWEALSDGTEPDLIIRTRDALIMIEVKYLSSLGADKTQLEREVARGLELSREKGLDFIFITLTNDISEPVPMKELRERYPPEICDYKCIWTSWRKAYDVVKTASEEETPYKTLLADLLAVMKKRGLQGFQGFGYLEGRLMKSKEALDLLNEISGSISTMFKELDPLLEKAGFVCLKQLSNTVIRDGAFRNLNEPQTWIPTYFARTYTKSFGETEPRDAIYFVKIKLDEEEPHIIVGGSILMERSDAKPFEHTEANRFFLDMRNLPLEAVDGIAMEDANGFMLYRLGNRLIVCIEKTLACIRVPDDLEHIASLFSGLRQALKSIDKQLKAST